MCVEDRKPQRTRMIKPDTVNGYRCEILKLKRLLSPYNKSEIIKLLNQVPVASNYSFVRRTDFWGNQHDESPHINSSYRRSNSSISTHLEVEGIYRGCKIMLNREQYDLLQSILDKTYWN